MQHKHISNLESPYIGPMKRKHGDRNAYSQNYTHIAAYCVCSVFFHDTWYMRTEYASISVQLRVRKHFCLRVYVHTKRNHEKKKKMYKTKENRFPSVVTWLEKKYPILYSKYKEKSALKNIILKPKYIHNKKHIILSSDFLDLICILRIEIMDLLAKVSLYILAQLHRVWWID